MTKEASVEDIRERAAIDRSTRFPVMFFFTSAAAWLLVATLLGFLSALKLRVPTLGEALPFWLEPFVSNQLMGYGRLMPAHMLALVYGWAIQAGLGVLIWLIARLSRSEVRYPVLITVAGHIWNLAVALGVATVIFGFGRSIPWLDFHKSLWPMFAIAYILIAVWIIPMFRNRRSSSIYISELYLLGAAVWFPWIFFTANLLINKGSAPTIGAGAGAWYVTNLIYFFMVPIALAVAYYIVPKIVGRPLYSYPVAFAAFWGLAFLSGWTGFARYMGGPFPAWMSAIGGTAALLIVIAIAVSLLNIHMTLRGSIKLTNFSPALRFTMAGMGMLGLYAILSAIGSTFWFGKYLQFTHFIVGLDTLAVYGFFSMTLFGAIYFIVPRIAGAEWPSSKKISRHFLLSAYGIGTLVACMLVGGIAQGGDLQRWNIPFGVSYTNAGAYIIGRTIAWLLILVSNLWFFWQLLMIFIGKGRKSSGPTLLNTEPGKAESAEAAASMATSHH